MKQPISTPEAPGAPFLSQALISGDHIFVSGQIHVLPDNTLVGDTTEEKLAQVMKNIETILKAAGVELNDIVKVVIYVTDMSIMPDFNKAYATYFAEPYPVREAVCVAALPLGASIELSVVAEKKQMQPSQEQQNDAIKVAPDLHQVIFENDKLRVLKVTVKPGATAAMHWHPENINYILAPGKLKFTKPDGTVTEVELTEGQVTSSPAGSHAVENIGDMEVRTVQVELKGKV